MTRHFEKESRIAPHPVIRADGVCFTGLAQAPLLLPLLVPGHDRVDVGEGYLQRHDAEAVALMEDGRGHERAGAPSDRTYDSESTNGQNRRRSRPGPRGRPD